MNVYSFELHENCHSIVLEGGSESDADAKREAVRFLGELLRDGLTDLVLPIGVTVLENGNPIYRLECHAPPVR